jgi:ankyrin repeat protein
VSSLQETLTQLGSPSDLLSEPLDRSGRTLLHLAARECRHVEDVIEVLLGCGASPAAVDRTGRTPLHVACEYSHLGAMRALLPVSSVHVVDSLGRGPFHLACCSDCPEAVKLMLAAHPDLITSLDSNGRSPLVYSLLGTHHEASLDITKALLEHVRGTGERRGWGDVNFHKYARTCEVDKRF